MAWRSEGGRSGGHSGGNGARRAMRALGDSALIKEMRAGRREAWSEFDARFRPMLETYAIKTRLHRSEWDVCVVAVLDDAAIRLMEPGVEIPASVQGYLVRAAHNRRLLLRRGQRRRDDAIERRAGDLSVEGVMRSLCSAAALRESEDPLADDDHRMRIALDHFVTLVERELDVDERHILGWVGEGVPRRQIAEWLGAGYEAVRKRILRIGVRVRRRVPFLLHELAPDDRRMMELLLKRVNVPVEGSNDMGRSGHAG